MASPAAVQTIGPSTEITRYSTCAHSGSAPRCAAKNTTTATTTPMTAAETKNRHAPHARYRVSAATPSWIAPNNSAVPMNRSYYQEIEAGEAKSSKGGAAACNSQDKLVVPTAAEEARANDLSAIWGEWGSQAARMVDCIGFSPSRGVVNPEAYGDRCSDPLLRQKPTVMNLDRLKVFHRVDVNGVHHWRAFTPCVLGMENCEFPSLTELFDVRFLGNLDLPDSDGRLYSKVKRVLLEWEIYDRKKRHTIEADARRAKPTVFTQVQEQKHDPLDMHIGSDGPSDDMGGENRADPLPSESVRVHHALIRSRNTGIPCNQLLAMEDEGREMSHAQQGDLLRAQANRNTYEIERGREYVAATLPEAPVELHVSRQALLETLTLLFGIPMSMISSGDASGRAKLNSETAGPETARIFREAQGDRKKQLERDIRTMYRHMFAAHHVQEYVKRVITKRAAASKKRKRSEPEPDYDAELGMEALNRQAEVRVQIPCNAERDALAQLLDKGVLRYDAFCGITAQQMGLPLSAFRETQSLSEDQQLMQGVLPPPVETGAKKPAKKAKKK